MRTVDVAATGRIYQDGLDVQALPRRRETLGEPSSRSARSGRMTKRRDGSGVVETAGSLLEGGDTGHAAPHRPIFARFESVDD